MQALAGIFTLLSVVGIGMLITRIATVALKLTGLSQDLARFQARSAFTTCGFTTSESEDVVCHPVRRRIVMMLMLLGNGMVVMMISSLIPVFLDTGGGRSTRVEFAMRMLLLVGGLSLIWWLSMSKGLDRRMSKLIERVLKRFFSEALDIQDYHSLLHLSEGYSVVEVPVREGSWLADKSLLQMRLSDEGMQVLGIHHADGSYVGTPTAASYLRPGDLMLIYGSMKDVPELESRPAGPEGDALHIERSRAQHRIMEAQEREDVLDSGTEESARMQAFHSLLHLSEGYSVTELTVETGNWMAGRTLAELRLTDEGMQVFGIRRADGDYIASPSGGTYIRKGDVLLMYGKTEHIAELETRPAGENGDAAHAQCVGELRGSAGESRKEARSETADALS